jgi:hypothetical protein
MSEDRESRERAFTGVIERDIISAERFMKDVEEHAESCYLPGVLKNLANFHYAVCLAKRRLDKADVSPETKRKLFDRIEELEKKMSTDVYNRVIESCERKLR